MLGTRVVSWKNHSIVKHGKTKLRVQGSGVVKMITLGSLEGTRGGRGVKRVQKLKAAPARNPELPTVPPCKSNVEDQNTMLRLLPRIDLSPPRH